MSRVSIVQAWRVQLAAATGVLVPTAMKTREATSPSRKGCMETPMCHSVCTYSVESLKQLSQWPSSSVPSTDVTLSPLLVNCSRVSLYISDGISPFSGGKLS